MSHTAGQFLKPSTAVSRYGDHCKVETTACASAESYNEEETDHEKATVYLVYERQQSRRFCINLHTFNLEENKGGLLEIPRSLQTTSSSINVCASAVALGSVIYLIGGCCGHPINVCYEYINVPHVHNAVVYFDTLKPDNGWQEAARMKSNRNLPTVVAVDGKIFVFGGVFNPGSLSQTPTPPLAEVYDPKDNSWSSLPDHPCLKNPRIFMPAAVHIISPTDKRILFQPDMNSLYSFNLRDFSWSLIDENFGYWNDTGAVKDDILYIYSTKFKQVHGYDLINKTRFDVVMTFFPGLAHNIQTAVLHNVGNGKLCLLYSDYDDDGSKIIICNTFKIRKEMNGDKLLHLTAIKVSDTNSFITAHTFWEMNVLML
ncbi:Kelch repeat type 1 [Corchorus capsularis]|uniref:Kelch repeat type 1 n=1 Tax=Corchorus capsularis TaxID=210143 RepID=A0A1R3JEB0_COCAP|nr:Kelch repeat type 1 [Corchorus capsularis]